MQPVFEDPYTSTTHLAGDRPYQRNPHPPTWQTWHNPNHGPLSLEHGPAKLCHDVLRLMHAFAGILPPRDLGAVAHHSGPNGHVAQYTIEYTRATQMSNIAEKDAHILGMLVSLAYAIVHTQTTSLKHERDLAQKEIRRCEAELNHETTEPHVSYQHHEKIRAELAEFRRMVEQNRQMLRRLPSLRSMRRPDAREKDVAEWLLEKCPDYAHHFEMLYTYAITAPASVAQGVPGSRQRHAGMRL